MAKNFRGIIGLCPMVACVQTSPLPQKKSLPISSEGGGRLYTGYPMEEWDVFLSERLQPDVRAGITRCKAQME